MFEPLPFGENGVSNGKNVRVESVKMLQNYESGAALIRVSMATMVDSDKDGTEHSCRREGQRPLACGLSRNEKTKKVHPTRSIVYIQ
ncbi:hypothetical protein MTBPR1_160003 [Candidatus Terasakiella magnetica]|uniref:Uncharacterized protein n=1 Tax=Candidatus Terasakiella magnetica TaxID=1867952 RepID=A0A1C3RFM0_9PROT|nr:hypothetical protein MTBPR1_160003 [Candidatus Terasakiella magnetica]